MPSPDENNAQPQQPGAGERQFAMQKIYVKDISFETPHSPQIFSEQWRPDVNLNLSSEAAPLSQNLYDVVLSVTVTVKVGDKTAFLAEVQQAGIFMMAGFGDTELGHMLGSFCPSILFPYARETVSDLVTRGGFPQFLMAPVNFDALYAQHLQQKAGQVGADTLTH